MNWDMNSKSALLHYDPKVIVRGMMMGGAVCVVQPCGRLLGESVSMFDGGGHDGMGGALL